MVPYHKIDTVFKRDPATKHKTLILGDYSNDAFYYLATNPWMFTEKVDGTNIRVMVTPADQGGGVHFGGKTAEAQIPATLVTKLQERFLPQKALLGEMFPDGACLYGEGYGAKIQKGGGNYRPDQDFVLFDVLVRSKCELHSATPNALIMPRATASPATTPPENPHRPKTPNDTAPHGVAEIQRQDGTSTSAASSGLGLLNTPSDSRPRAESAQSVGGKSTAGVEAGNPSHSRSTTITKPVISEDSSVGPATQQSIRPNRSRDGLTPLKCTCVDWWLQRDAIKDVASKLGLLVVPVIGVGTLADMVTMARGGFNSMWGSFRAEGIVARPVVELKTRNGDRIITKIKHKDFDFAEV